METVIKELLAEGWAVQLKHAPEETSWEDTETHGFVKVKDAAGKVLCDVPGFQHNKKLGRAQQKSLETIMATVGEPQESDEASTAPSEKAASKEAA